MSARWLTTADGAAWDAVLPASRSVFGSVGFARALERSGGPRGELLVVELDGTRITCPYALRPIRELPFATGDDGLDAATPPFTGPYVEGGPLAGEALAEARALVEDALARRGIVTDFCHLHPFASEPRLAGDVAADREIVWVDARLDAERLWRESYSRACRKNVNRAAREGVEVRAGSSAGDVAELHRIYLETMERAGAAPAYRFEARRFAALVEELPENARIVIAEHEGRALAATLYLHDAADVYSYLGGARHEHQHVRPTNAVVHDAVRWAREQGKRRLILGGGYRPGDGIMRFKASFSPLRATLELGRRVHRRQQYERLVAAWRERAGAEADDGGYFPAYRAGAG